ncbi:MAG: hypothetical protein ACXVZH_08210 [Terriglobales bacterium]
MKRAALLLAVVLIAGTACGQSSLSCELVPGWQHSGASRQYTADNLYEYMDGNAEVRPAAGRS